MSELSPYIMLLIGLLFGAIVVWFYQHARLGKKIQDHNDELSQTLNELTQQATIENLTITVETMNKAMSSLQAQVQEFIERVKNVEIKNIKTIA